MDECDGMSSSDRGGIQALTQIIIETDVPIICICNDREKQQIRTLSKYCVDLKFTRPQPKQMLGRMMQIGFKEGMNGKIKPPRPDIAVSQRLNCRFPYRDIQPRVTV